MLTELTEGLRDERAVQVTEGQATLVSAELPARMNRVARQRLAGLSDRAQHLLSTAAVLGETFRLPDLAGMLGDTPAGLLPLVEETLAAGMVVADDAAFSFRQPLIGRALGQLVPRPARSALHRQFGELLLRRGESPAAASAICSKPPPPETARRWRAWITRPPSCCPRIRRPPPGWRCGPWT